MKEAYAGGMYDPYEEQVQQVYEEMYEPGMDSSFSEQIVTEIGDSFGYSWILGLALLGAVWFFRKKIRSFFL